MAFDERLPRLEQLADDADAGVALKALDMLAKYGGMVFTEAESRVDIAPVMPMRIYEMPDNGRGVGSGPADDDDPPASRPARPAARAQVPPNGNRGGYPPGYLWPDGSWRVIPPE
jgi:hypothetical protein